MLNVFMTPSALAIFNFSKDNLVLAAQTVLLGMGMIFAILGLLWGVLSLFKLIFVGVAPKAPKAQKAPEAKKEVKTEEAVVTAPAVEDNNDAQLVAIITAAVAAYMADEGAPDGSFRVVSFKRVQSGRAWNSK